MENRKETFLKKILNIFEDAGFGIEKYSDDEYIIVDRSKIGKIDAGSVKVKKSGDISVRLNGESSKRRKFANIMSDTTVNCKITHNVAQIGKMVKSLVKDYKTASKTVYKESCMIRECTEQELEDVIESYLEMADVHAADAPISVPDMTQYVADELGMTIDDVDEKFGRILSAALDNDEDAYIDAVDRAFYENNLKQDFAEYWEKNKDKFNTINESCEDIVDSLKKDSGLKTLRSTPNYIDGTLEYKYRLLWKYAVREYGHKLSDEDEVADACMTIAEEDEGRI